MKILAIRLKNLASLAGPFELDFTAEPLASAGLFAITGPTGAGKSTLLDALCLALFGAVPRLNNTSRDAKVPDMEGEIATGDPRTLLRRGTGEGYAEVDFLGIDGRRYGADCLCSGIRHPRRCRSFAGAIWPLAARFLGGRGVGRRVGVSG